MREHAIAYVGAAIISLLLFSTIFALVSNSKNKRRLNREKLQSEAILSEKLLVQKDFDKLKSDLIALNIRNDTNEKALIDAELKITEKEQRIASLSRQNISLNKNRKELADLRNEKADMDKAYKAYEDLKMEHEKILTRERELQSSVVTLEAQKNEITDKFNKKKLYDSDNFEVYGSRGRNKEKLTVRAWRTKKLNVSFDVPESLTESVSFKIVTPSGSVISPEDKALSWSFPGNSVNYTASLSYLTGEIEQSRQVVLTYNSKEKLPKGDYKVQLFCNSVNIGNCRIKLK